MRGDSPCLRDGVPSLRHAGVGPPNDIYFTSMIQEENDGFRQSPEVGVDDDAHDRFLRHKKNLGRIMRRLMVLGLLTQAEVQKTEAHEPPIAPPEAAAPSADYQTQVEYLENVFGYVKAHQIERWTPRLEGADTPEPKFENFDPRHLTEQELRNLLITTYPRNWIKTEIDRVVFSADSVGLPDQYGLNQPMVGTVEERAGSAKVTIYHRTAGDLERVAQIYAHESGHVNWTGDASVKYEERVELLYAVAKRFLTGRDCYPSAYVQEINNPDPQKADFLRIQEYWAEVCEAYFTDPDDLRRHPEDFALVDTWVKKQDPDYEPYAAAAERAEIIFQYRLRFLRPPVRQAVLDYRQSLLTAATRTDEKSSERTNTLSPREIMSMMTLGKKYKLSVDDQLWFAAAGNRWVRDRLRAEKTTAGGVER